MRFKKIKRFIQLFSFLLLTTWCYASGIDLNNGHSNIQVKEKNVQGVPKSSSIQASIDGHVLSVVFTENLGHVQIEVTTSTGGTVDLMDIYTPNGYNAYISYTGDYVVTFTLSNGDEYYGEFTVTN